MDPSSEVTLLKSWQDVHALSSTAFPSTELPWAAGAPDEVPTSDGAAAGEQAATIRVKLNTNNAKNKIFVFIFPPMA
jgi:hypothetical protein